LNNLFVRRGERIVGTLEDTQHGPIFRYSEEWLKDKTAEPLSGFLPLTRSDFTEDTCRAFFENLIPEGRERDILGRTFQVSSLFGFLKTFGRDLVGGYTVEDSTASDPARYIPVDRKTLRRLMNTGTITVVNHYQGYRISMAGAQEKLAMYLGDNGELFIPVYGAPSTHILKPNIQGLRSVKNSALNETFIMRLAQSVGLPTAEIAFDSELAAALVTRFDRRRSPHGEISTVPQLDVCQALGIGPEKKYELDGGPDLSDVIGLVKRSGKDPALDAVLLLKWVVFSALCGNLDNHAKNVSFYYDRGLLKVAPFYDMMNTFIYTNTSRNMAFRVGGEFRPNGLARVHWNRLANAAEFSRVFVEGHVRCAATSIEKQIALVRAQPAFSGLGTQDKTFLNRVERDIVGRSRKWLRGLNREHAR